MKFNAILEPYEILDRIIKVYNPKYVVALFSGGHDSLVSTHIASQHPRFSFACHLNTGIGIKDTRTFVRETCKEWSISLKEYAASDYIGKDGKPAPQIYDALVLDPENGGFPGPPMHTKMFNRLKERPLRHMIRELDRTSKDKTLLVTGARSQESHRRNTNFRRKPAHSKIVRDPRNYAEIWEGTKIFGFPILNLSKTDTTRYIKSNGIRRNPVVDKIHMSGECLCGAYAHKGELDEIGLWFPEVKKRIQELETQVNQAGYPWKWEQSPPKWYMKVKKGHQFLPGLEPVIENILCASCKLNPGNNQTL